MSNTLFAGVVRRVINPVTGHDKVGLRLFGDPIQAIETDLTATVLVLANGSSKVAIIACDLCLIPGSVVSEARRKVAEAIETPASHRSEEHTSELQSLTKLVCRLLLEKKK